MVFKRACVLTGTWEKFENVQASSILPLGRFFSLSFPGNRPESGSLWWWDQIRFRRFISFSEHASCQHLSRSLALKKKKAVIFQRLDYFTFYSIVSSILLYTPDEKNRESFRAFSCVYSSSIAERCSNVTVSGHNYKIPLCFAFLLTGRQKHFSKWSFLQSRIKYSISIEFQPVNTVYHQWKWHEIGPCDE